ncbi:hypothetical protein REC12_09120 [Desulfosporosinus sp. PR]|uniref:hypothetical protein n=1 Tax=Candidatus Desulfosporosinus nitrosoreducens TaxID=3401928 RepID=UPI0027F6AACE|nr:hypothetical protein [Desulfosporosinus sp. PR]MDQ7093751.1 hypothetical protein [Desulfosporosinus sp. PR]
MNLPTILLGLGVAVLLTLAIRYLVKNGTCAACEAKGACHSAKVGSSDMSLGCGGGCAGCHSCPSKAAPLKH